jgi:hypothetical protein
LALNFLSSKLSKYEGGFMKRIVKLIIVLVFLALSSKVAAQRGHPHGRPYRYHARAKNVVVVKRSPYRPAKVVVFHPVWRPKYSYYHRWIFFPRYNLYWDNWRNHYVFWNGTVWLSQPTPPPAIVNVDLDKEKSQELNESNDDTDDIYNYNSAHKEQTKGD